jgi:shikimate dehydrogenase
MSNVLNYVENNVDFSTNKYAVIIGESPSQGARSPLLWNAVFQNKGMDCLMYPFDVKPENIESLVAELRKDERFVGGACTMPYKQTILPLLDELEPEAEKIGAVNCIYRKGAKLIGANTDGAGAIPKLSDIINDNFNDKNVLLMGLGGAGRSVAAYMANNVAHLTIASGNTVTANEFAALLGNHVSSINSPPSKSDLEGVNILINCTSVGFDNQQTGMNEFISLRNFTSLTTVNPKSVPSSGNTDTDNAKFDALNEDYIKESQREYINLLSVLPSDAIVFDIIYQPAKTLLLQLAKSLKLKTLNGLAMNLEQAVIAFYKVTHSEIPMSSIRAIMKKEFLEFA